MTGLYAQGKALQELKLKIQLLEAELDGQSLAIAASSAEKDANFSLLQEALQRAEVRKHQDRNRNLDCNL